MVSPVCPEIHRLNYSPEPSAVVLVAHGVVEVWPLR